MFIVEVAQRIVRLDLAEKLACRVRGVLVAGTWSTERCGALYVCKKLPATETMASFRPDNCQVDSVSFVNGTVLARDLPAPRYGEVRVACGRRVGPGRSEYKEPEAVHL